MRGNFFCFLYFTQTFPRHDIGIIFLILTWIIFAWRPVFYDNISIFIITLIGEPLPIWFENTFWVWKNISSFIIEGNIVYDFFTNYCPIIIHLRLFSYLRDNFSIFIYKSDFSSRFYVNISFIFYRKIKTNIEIIFIFFCICWGSGIYVSCFWSLFKRISNTFSIIYTWSKIPEGTTIYYFSSPPPLEVFLIIGSCISISILISHFTFKRISIP